MPAQSLTERLFDDADAGPIDPYAVFEDWFAEAQASEPNDPHAMALATADPEGLPDVRMVLLNRRDALGFCIFTNFESEKGRQLLANPKAAFVMHWKSLRRQVRGRGRVETVSAQEADDYFASRPRKSQIASIASAQSRPLSRRQDLVTRVSELEGEIGDGPVRRPPHWSGFRIVPVEMEFWKDGAHRLHDRVRFTRGAGGTWARQRLNP